MPHIKYRDELIEEVAQRLLQCRPGEHFWIISGLMKWGTVTPMLDKSQWQCSVCGVMEDEYDRGQANA